MPTFIKYPLSGSVNGQPINITSGSSPTTTPVHTTPSGTSSLDEIYLYATPTGSISPIVYICWGNTGSATTIPMTLTTLTGRTLICDGMVLQNGLTVSAYTNSASVIVDGFVNRMTY